ncbi:MAG TPA: cytidine deaminase [Polyangiaceae bacterium]|nr:cytidine deaminase [Polyangiaceae bacterium]
MPSHETDRTIEDGPLEKIEISRDVSDEGPENPELVIGLVSAVGTPLKLVQQAIQERLGSYSYSAEVLRLSDYSQGFLLDVEDEESGEAGRIDAAMTRGNDARAKTGRNDILALAGIADIQNKRGNEPGPMPGRAFVLRQLKRPEEVQLLRRTYGEGFVLIGVFCRRSERKKNLQQDGVAPDRAEGLISRDEHEALMGGQALRDTFHLADLFLEVGDDIGAVRRDLNRMLDLLFGLGISTPTLSEAGMFHAHAASLRSSQLGRQVGAALLTEDGDVISVGTNEVPRAGGGLYWEGDSDDARDHRRGRDSSDEAKKEIVREILEVLDEGWQESTPGEKQCLIYDRMQQLRGTRVMSLIEFGRAVHAEAESIISAARRGTATANSDLYCTTFPCHVCAKHIVAAGVKSVTYIEPYPKSRALELHDDSIALEDEEDGKVLFRPFVGVAPRAYGRVFSMIELDGGQIRRKDDDGAPIMDRARLRFRMPYLSALQRESLVAKELMEITPKEGRNDPETDAEH